MTLKPSFGNLILWKSIYQNKQTFYVDAIRVVQSSTVCLGESIKIFDYQQHLPDLDKAVSYTHLTLPTILLV